jgi:hypothetical protein
MAPRLARALPLWQVRAKGRGREFLLGTGRDSRVAFEPGCQSRHSSVVEHVIGNDGVDCSIQSGGTIKSMT